MDLVKIPRGRDFHFAAVSQLHLAFEIKLRINPALRERLADHVAREGFRRIGFRIPHGEIAELLVLFIGETLDFFARAAVGQRARVV